MSHITLNSFELCVRAWRWVIGCPCLNLTRHALRKIWQYSSSNSEWVTVMANIKTSATPCQGDQNFNAVENRHLSVWKFKMSLLIVYNGLRVTHNSLTNTGSNIYHLSQVCIAIFTFVSFPNGRVKTDYRLMCKRKSKVSKGHLILLQ
jgi:hypothetical protein